MNQTDNQIPKLYYTMGEVAEMLDVSQSLLRFWEKEFDIIRPRRNRKGNRLFTKEDVKNLKIIYHLVKEQGMKLAAAKKQMKLRAEGVSREMLLAEKLHAIRAILLEIKQSIDNDDSQSVIEDSAETTFQDSNDDLSTLYTVAEATESCCEEDTENNQSNDTLVKEESEVAEPVQETAAENAEIIAEIESSIDGSEYQVPTIQEPEKAEEEPTQVQPEQQAESVPQTTEPTSEVTETVAATTETVANTPTPEAVVSEEKPTTQKTKDKPKRSRKPKAAFKEVELFSLTELDEMQPKRPTNDEKEQTLF